MSAPIRLLHFSDLHIGMENYGRLDASTGTSTRVRDFLDRLDEIVDYALEHRADLVVFTGDAFKTRDPDPTQQREFARRIKRLAQTTPTLLLVGNHDLPGTVQKASSLDIYRVLDVPNVIVGHSPGSQVVNTASGPVFLAWIPYPMRNRLLVEEEHRLKTLEELDQALRSILIEFLRAFREEAQARPMPRVLAGHFSIGEARLGSERLVLIGRDVTVPRSEVADPAWDYVAMGHIHQHQNLTAGVPGLPPVVYSGSLERIDFGEEKEPKGFAWVDLERGRATYEFIPVKARPFVTIRADLADDLEPTQSLLDQLKSRGPQLEGAVVRLLVRLKAEQVATFDDRQVLRALDGCAHVAIQKEILRPDRARLGSASPEALTPLQLLEQYFQSKGVAAERLASLLALAHPYLEGAHDPWGEQN
ncbi:MAG: exonuclease SbcCD subunit D [Anaerolineales bacterium]|jgi:exonuclease SbcD